MTMIDDDRDLARLIDRAGEQIAARLTSELAEDREGLLSRIETLEGEAATRPAFGEAGEGRRQRARHPLADQASAASILDHVVFDRHPNDASRELQADLGLNGDEIPLDLLDVGGVGGMEAAASSVTSSGDMEVQGATLQPVFASPLSDGFGVARSEVMEGIHNRPVVTAPTAAVSGPTAIGTALSDETVTIGNVQFSPHRLGITATVGLEEKATFRGLEGDVGAVLSAAVASGLDRDCLYADSASVSSRTGGSGLLNSGTAPTQSTTVVAFDTGVASVTDRIDGRYASTMDELSALFGPLTYALLARTYRSNESDVTVIEALRRLGIMAMTTAQVADAASDNQEGLVFRGRGRADMASAQLVWNGVQVVRDPFTLATAGQIRITLNVMTDFHVLRADQYVRQSYHLA